MQLMKEEDGSKTKRRGGKGETQMQMRGTVLQGHIA